MKDSAVSYITNGGVFLEDLVTFTCLAFSKYQTRLQQIRIYLQQTLNHSKTSTAKGTFNTHFDPEVFLQFKFFISVAW